MLHISYSAVSTFMDCRTMYKWRYKKNLERIKFDISYLMGRLGHFGVNKLYEKSDKAIAETIKYFNSEKQKMRSHRQLPIKQEQELNNQEVIIRGILGAYKEKHKKHIKQVSIKSNEFAFEYQINKDTIIHCQIDNLKQMKKKIFIHELKTTKYLNEDYVKNIKNDLQTAIYFHMYELKFKTKLGGIIYDVIQKPSIRQKQTENKEQFLTRLGEWYKQGERELFYMEIINSPMLKQDRIVNLLNKVSRDILACKTDDDYYPNERFCYVYKRCEFYDICHEGEKKELLINFKPRREK